MQHEPVFSVVVITHDHADTLPACLDSVHALRPQPQTVVVLDNASKDGSAQLARRWHDRLPLRLIPQEHNTGFAAGANTAIAAAGGEWVLLLNPDCALEAGFVARLLAAGQRHPGTIGSLTGRLVRAKGPELDPTGQLDAAGMVVTPSGRHLDRGAGEADDGRYRRPAWVFGGTAAACLYRRAALNDVAYCDGEFFAPTFFAYREDAELAWRLQWRGWRCLYVPQAVAAHRRGFRPEKGRGGQALINSLSVRNRFLLRAHCGDMGWHLRCLPWWLLRDLLVIGACLTVERSSLPALAQAWRLRHDALRRRRHVLGRAKVTSRQVSRWFRKRGRVEEVV